MVKSIFSDQYALLFVWGRSRCTVQPKDKHIDARVYSGNDGHLGFVKHLSKVKRRGYAPLEKILIIDDTPSKAKHNYGNAIYPTPYTGQDDHELPKLF